MSELAARNFFNIYPEKSQAGLRLLDLNGAVVQQARYPRNVYADFAAVPELVARTLLYVEDRELLEPARPTMNPVIDWERLGVAVGQQAEPRRSTRAWAQGALSHLLRHVGRSDQRLLLGLDGGQAR